MESAVCHFSSDSRGRTDGLSYILLNSDTVVLLLVMLLQLSY